MSKEERPDLLGDEEEIEELADRIRQEGLIQSVVLVMVGVTTSQIKARTGINEKKIWDIVNRLKRQGKVKSAGRGVYIKA